MIVHLDHIALNSINFDRDIKVLEQLGYSLEFVQKNKPNLPFKKNLMKVYADDHDLALLKKPDNISIELLNHRNTNNSSSFILPIFENINNSMISIDTKIYFNNETFLKGNFNSFDAPVFVVDSNKEECEKDFSFNKFYIKSRDIEESINFWKCFGFKTLIKTEKIAIIQFISIFTKETCQLYLENHKIPEDPYYLDDNGFNCIAFISNSAKKERDFLNKKGINTTDTLKFTPNDKELSIFFAKGPSNEIVEVIGL